MHLLINTEPVNLGGGLPDLQPGEWLVHDANAFEIALRAPRGTVKIKDHGWEKYLNPERKDTLIMRSGAIGDLLMLTPVLQEWMLCTNTRPTVSCFEHHWPIFPKLSEPFLTFAESYPLPVARLEVYREVISLENTMETNHNEHASDVFAKALGLPTPLRSYKPIYYVREAEQVATAKWIFKGRPNLAIQPRASIPNRDYPGQLWGEVIIELEKRGWGILIIGRRRT